MVTKRPAEGGSRLAGRASPARQIRWLRKGRELQRHQSPHLATGDLLDGRVDDIDGRRHPPLVHLTDVEPRQQMVEKRLRTTSMHCFVSHCRGVGRTPVAMMGRATVLSCKPVTA